MNNVYFGKNTKLQTRNRTGMIRSYRTTRTFPEMLGIILDMILTAFDGMLDVLARPTVRRIARTVTAIACIAVFLCLISAVENQLLATLPALLIALALVGIEILCLRGN
ncbi:MAG: hypothetical protein IJW99_04050 [Clostridia bacterium]|nr:hypothetical protein [Clostridia bacterium]